MDLHFDHEGDHCYATIEYESKEELVSRLLREDQMKIPELYGDRTERFFENHGGSFLLHRLATGEDSDVYIFFEKKSERYGLIKLYDPEQCPTRLIDQYRALTQQLIDDESIINQKIDLNAKLAIGDYAVSLRFVPVGDVVERNGVNGIFIEREDWIRGDDVGASRSFVEKDQLYGSLAARDVSEGGDSERMFAIPYPDRGEAIDLLESNITPLLRTHTGVPDFWVYKTNVKVEIDRTRKRLILVVTDVSDSIQHTTFATQPPR